MSEQLLYDLIHKKVNFDAGLGQMLDFKEEDAFVKIIRNLVGKVLKNHRINLQRLFGSDWEKEGIQLGWQAILHEATETGTGRERPAYLSAYEKMQSKPVESRASETCAYLRRIIENEIITKTLKTWLPYQIHRDVLEQAASEECALETLEIATALGIKKFIGIPGSPLPDLTTLQWDEQNISVLLRQLPRLEPNGNLPSPSQYAGALLEIFEKSKTKLESYTICKLLLGMFNVPIAIDTYSLDAEDDLDDKPINRPEDRYSKLDVFADPDAAKLLNIKQKAAILLQHLEAMDSTALPSSVSEPIGRCTKLFLHYYLWRGLRKWNNRVWAEIEGIKEHQLDYEIKQAIPFTFWRKYFEPDEIFPVFEHLQERFMEFHPKKLYPAHFP